MPALPLPTLLGSLVIRHEPIELIANTTHAAVNSTSEDFLRIVCAWPLSGQYGTGARVLYYVLVATCVFARKAEWLRNACLAAALLFPAVAAIHGIVLASMHVQGAIDLDVYGAFQLCALGALAAPVTVRLSSTYFYDNGRNLIFIWTLLVLAGLISLAVEFYRLDDIPCRAFEGQGNPADYTLATFPYGDATCGLTCSTEDGPFSAIRGGSADNIYVVPSPTALTFKAAMLLSAGCCIPAVLLLLSMWIKILENNRKGKDTSPERPETSGVADNDDLPSSATNDADTEETTAERRHRAIIGAISRYGEVLMLGAAAAAVLALLIAGERNLFSHQLRYQTEPIANIGQWAPIVGTGFAVFGSLYVLLAGAMKEERETMAHENDPPREPIHLVQHVPQDQDIYAGDLLHGERAIVFVDQSGKSAMRTIDLARLDVQTATVRNLWSDHISENVGVYNARVSANSALLLRLSKIQHLQQRAPDLENDGSQRADLPATSASTHGAQHVELKNESNSQATEAETSNPKYRAKRSRPHAGIMHTIARFLIDVTDYFATPAEKRWDSDFRHGDATLYPEVPGEKQRNSNYHDTRSRYRPRRDSNGSLHSATSRQPARSRSLAPSVASHSEPGARTDRSNTQGGSKARRRSTLDVPNSWQRDPILPSSPPVSPSADDIVALPGSPIAPAITVSSDVYLPP